MIFKRTVDQVDKLQIDLKNTQDLLSLEKEKKATHSSRAIQELHEQLNEERKKAETERKKAEEAIKAEQNKANSYAMRLRLLEGTPDTETLSKALEETHDLSESVKTLTEQNTCLKNTANQENEEKKALMDCLTEMENKMNSVTKSMDTLSLYCGELEAEKKKLQQDAIAKKNLQPLLSSLNLADDLLTLGPISFSDDDESRCDHSVQSILSWGESVSAPLALVKEQDENRDSGNSSEEKRSITRIERIKSSTHDDGIKSSTHDEGIETFMK